MAEYSTAAASAQTALNNNTSGGFVTSYTVSNGSRSVSMASPLEQVNALARLEGLAARRAGAGLFKLAKPQEPTT